MIYIKVHQARYWRTSIALCDAELLGKEFEEGKMHMQVHRQFYEGHVASKEEIIQSTKTAYMLNAVGKKAIDLLVKENLIEKDSVQWIAGIPFVQIVRAP